MIDLAKLILLLRPDLCRRFEFHLPENKLAFNHWLVNSGLKEYKSLAGDLSFKKRLNARAPGIGHHFSYLQYLLWIGRPDLQRAFPLPFETKNYLRWFYTHGVLECGIWNFLKPKDKKQVLLQKDFWQPQLASLKTITSSDPNLITSGPLPGGVNLIGYAFGQLGIGEDVRMAAKALEAAAIPFAVVNFEPGADIGQNDRSIAHYVKPDGPYAINMFCLTALETGRFYAEKGINQFKGRYNIGYWPWELGKWPKKWESLVPLVDEVWVSSKHTYDSLVPVIGNRPLKLMPMAVDLGPIKSFASRAKARSVFGLPKKATLFCFAFDLKSQLHRKNPKACIYSFLNAFPADQFNQDQVGLVIKVLKPSQKNAQWDRLKRLAKSDPRIHIIEQTLSRPDLLALYQCCDCYLSLHRAEGFGRGIAEALQLGLHIITTGYSGNVDFCQPPRVDLVSYKLIPVGKGQYPFGDHQSWADPEVSDAARLMHLFFTSKDHNRLSNDFPQFSPMTIGKRYLARLKEIKAAIAKARLS